MRSPWVGLGSDLVRFRAVSRRLGDRLMGQPARFEGSVSLAQDLGLELLGLPRGTSSYFAPEITVVRHFSQNVDVLRILRVRGIGIAGPGLGLEAAQDHRGTSRLIYQKITIVRHFSQNADALRFLRVRGSGIAGPGPRSGARARPSRHI